MVELGSPDDFVGLTGSRGLSRGFMAVCQRIIVAIFCSIHWFVAPFCEADIIGPAPATENKPLSVPQSLLSEIDPKFVDQLNPLMNLFVANDLPAFRTEYKKISATTSTLPTADVFWAKLLVASNRLGEAITTLEQYAKQSPDDPEVHLTLGIVAARSGRFTDAWLQLLYTQRLIDKQQLSQERFALVNFSLLEARAVVAEARQQWGEAEQTYDKMIALKPDDAFVKWRAGRLQVLAGNVDKGHQIMTEACKQDAKLPAATLSVAQILVDSSDWFKNKKSGAPIEQWFSRSMEENPKDQQGITSFFKWLVLDDRPEVVLQKFEELTPENKKSRDVALIRAVAARYLDDLTTAETLLAPFHQENPDDLEVADQLALIWVESSDEAKRSRSLQLSERNFRAASNLEQVAATAAWVQFKLGSIDVADRILSQLVARGPLTPQTTYYVAELVKRKGNVQESQRLLKLAVETVGLFPQRAKVREQVRTE